MSKKSLKELGPKSGPNYHEGKAIYINESGVYDLVLRSKLPSAKAFKRWKTELDSKSESNYHEGKAVNVNESRLYCLKKFERGGTLSRSHLQRRKSGLHK